MPCLYYVASKLQTSGKGERDLIEHEEEEIYQGREGDEKMGYVGRHSTQPGYPLIGGNPGEGREGLTPSHTEPRCRVLGPLGGRKGGSE